jgi:hypothetical protein
MPHRNEELARVDSQGRSIDRGVRSCRRKLEMSSGVQSRNVTLGTADHESFSETRALARLRAKCPVPGSPDGSAYGGSGTAQQFRVVVFRPVRRYQIGMPDLSYFPTAVGPTCRAEETIVVITRLPSYLAPWVI